jgi:uncharacterized protein (DUF169 family)
MVPPAKDDYDILNRFEFKAPPVCVKYLATPIQGMSGLNEDMALCEMLKKAFEGDSFFAGAKNHKCEAGLYVLGQTGLAEPFKNGEFGAGMEVFRDRRSAGRLYHYIPRIDEGAVKYVAFSPFNNLLFEPDVLIVLADTRQAEILLRAMSYGTGEMWQNRYSTAIGCAWLFVYPYLNGEINFIPTGLGFGMRRRKLFPEGLHFVCIPYDRLPYMLQTLREMPWVPRPFQPDGPDYVKKLRIRLGLDK